MKKLLITLTDQDQAELEKIKEIYNTKTETAAIRKALKYTYDSKEMIQTQLLYDRIDHPEKDWRITKDILDELDPIAKQTLLRELYDKLIGLD